ERCEEDVGGWRRLLRLQRDREHGAGHDKRQRAEQREPVRRHGFSPSSSSRSSAPFSTAVPGATATRFTVPVVIARSSFSIFIASITPSPCPGCTASPTVTLTRTISPGIGATSGAGPVAAAA